MINYYKTIGQLFKYPSKNLLNQALMLEGLMQENFSDEAESFSQFISHVQDKSLNELQEYYVSTFDIQALCHIDVGYTLFGEDLKRGDFLVKLQGEYSKYDIDLENELPDFLPNVLTLLAASTDTEFKNEFVQFILLPAIITMIKGFKSESNVYLKLLNVLKEILIQDFSIEEIKIEIPENKDCVFAGNGCSVNDLEKY